MKREMMVLGVFVLSLGAVFLSHSNRQVHAAEKKKLLRVGVYDSRGIAIAYGNSAYWEAILKEKQAALEQAKKDGDTEKVKEIEAWGPAQQVQAHLKAFGTAPVHDYLEPVKDRIPEVARAAGVDVVVSKWELDYIAADAETVDVTMQLAKLFDPREKVYQWIEQMKDKEPISHEELERLERQGMDF